MKRRRKAFTLVEMVMAISITAITGLAVAGVTVALSNAHAHSETFYQSLRTGHFVMHRLQNGLRCARLVTATNNNAYFVTLKAITCAVIVVPIFAPIITPTD